MMTLIPSKLVQIVPSNLPGHCGLSDYSSLLAQELRSAWNTETLLAVISAKSPAFHAHRGFTAYPAPANSAEGIRDAVLQASASEAGRPIPVLLQLAPYSYDAGGAPVELVRGLTMAKASSSGLVLATMFHEIHQQIPVFRRSHWTSGARQRRAIAAAMEITEIVLTNCQAHRAILTRWLRPGVQIAVLPVFSNLGEPQEFVPFAQRRARMMVMGQPRSRVNSYGRFAAGLARAVRTLRVEEICDVGLPVENCPREVAGCPVTQLGWLPPERIGQLLLDSRFGFVAHGPEGQGKSGIMAAVCAHGAVPVLAGAASACTDGLILGVDCWSSEKGGKLSAGQPEAIGSGAYAWYQGHGLHQHAETVARALAFAS